MLQVHESGPICPSAPQLAEHGSHGLDASNLLSRIGQNATPQGVVAHRLRPSQATELLRREVEIFVHSSAKLDEIPGFSHPLAPRLAFFGSTFG